MLGASVEGVEESSDSVGLPRQTVQKALVPNDQRETYMFRSMNEIIGYKIEASDGELGRAKDFLFDDHSWVIRYLAVETGGWLLDRQVLISPQAMGDPDWAKGVIPVALTKIQVENSPGIESDLPVSRQHEQRLAEYYDWQPYWQYGLPLGGPIPMMPVPAAVSVEDSGKKEPPGDPDLRSVKEVTGYRIHASDGDIGHVAEFIVQTEGWVIRYLVVDTRNWLPGKKILISPAWVKQVNWDEKRLHVEMSREQIRGSVEFDPSAPINREYEARLYDYYGRPKYW